MRGMSAEERAEHAEYEELAEALGELRACAVPGDLYRVIPVRDLRRTLDAIRPHKAPLHATRVLIVSSPVVDRFGLLRLGDISAPDAIIEWMPYTGCVDTLAGFLRNHSYHLIAVTEPIKADLDVVHVLRDRCRLSFDIV